MGQETNAALRRKLRTQRAAYEELLGLAGAIMAALGLLESMLGFDENMIGLMIATYIAMDSFGTATNVTGDGAIAVIVNAIDSRMIRREKR